MPFAAAVSTRPQAPDALAEVLDGLSSRVPQPDLAVVFFSPHHADSAGTIAATLREKLTPRALLGSVGESIIGNDQEIEDQPALSVWLGRWGGSSRVTADPFHLYLERTSEGISLLGWPDALVGADQKTSAILLVGDPYTFPADFFLDQINDDHVGLRVIGGMASGVSGRGECRLLLDGAVKDAGAVGVLLQGPLGLRSIVSQGCRPIGRHMVVTRADENIIFELGGRSPLAQLQELWPTLGERDRQLLQRGLHVGRVINEYLSDFQRGDFLVRNVMGMDRDSGAMQITDRIRVGQTVQFHVRDAATADEDLHALMQMDLSAHDRRPAAALVFSCNGRGTKMFDEPHHDARAVRAEAGPIPLAGFFAAGELGPVGGQNFVHGFTASVALFEE
jgi:small ligand-binding sensory domain FIST